MCTIHEIGLAKCKEVLLSQSRQARSRPLTHPKLSSQHQPQRQPSRPHTPTHTTMPPRLKTLRLASALLARPHVSRITPLLAPFLLPTQQRSASILSSLSDNDGAYNKRIRRGRGPSSGKGKTGGRGQKGQHAHGKVPAGFEGGQTPLSVTTPVRGRNKYNP